MKRQLTARQRAVLQASLAIVIEMVLEGNDKVMVPGSHRVGLMEANELAALLALAETVQLDLPEPDPALTLRPPVPG